MTRLQGQKSSAPLVIATLLVALLIAAGVWWAQRSHASQAASTFDYAGQPFLGQASAPVKMVVFEDFKCPNCKSFEENIFPEIQQKYVDTGKVQVYKINYPFLAMAAQLPTDDSLQAAEAAECVYDQKSNDGYNRYAAILFRAQGSEQTVWATKDKLEELAGSVDGLDMGRFHDCLQSDATKARVEADKKQGDNAGVQGTPSVFVNGKLIETFSAEDIGKAIDAAQ